jgi:hypothetical protein
MTHPLLKTALAALLATAAALPAVAAEPAKYRVPRTPFGAPDLQGLWTNTSLTFLSRPPIFKNLVATEAEEKMMQAGFKSMIGDLLKPTADPKAPAPPVVKEAPNSDFLEMDLNLAKIRGQPRTSQIVEPADGQIPFTDEGKKANRALSKNSFDGPEGRPLTERCLIAIGSPEGPPMLNTGFNAHYQIIQTREFVSIQIEMNHDVRTIRMKDRSHAPASVRPWMGDSIGWYEGDTLVVETTNFNPSTQVSSMTGGFTYSPQGKLTERFTRVGKDEILYEFKVEDPAYFKQPWRGEQPWRTAKGPIYEYACHEGNYSLANALTGARAEERVAAEAKPAAPAAASPAPSAQGAAKPDLHSQHTGQPG